MKTTLGKVRLQLAFGFIGGGLAHVMAAYLLCYLAGATLTSIPTLLVVYGSLAVLVSMNVSAVWRTWRYISIAAEHELKWCWPRALAYGVYGRLALPRPPRPPSHYDPDDEDADGDDDRSNDWDYMRDYVIPLGLLDKHD